MNVPGTTHPSPATALNSLAGTFELDPVHSRLGFSVRHMVTPVHGRFTVFTGRIDLTGPDLEHSTVEVTIDPSSIQTNDADRDAHLRSADFFDAERYPGMTFRGTDVLRVVDDHFTMMGDLTVKETTRQIALDFTYLGSGTDPYGQYRLGFTGTGVISRKEFGLTWNVALETGGFVVGDRITLELDVAAVAAP